MEAVALPTTHDVVLAVQDGRVDRALAPIENSLEGEVTPVADALAHDAPDVVLTGEHVLAVRLCVVAATAQEPRDLRRVLSHPQPLGQCAGWLRDHAPGAALEATASTVDAVARMLEASADGATGVAAIAPRAAAERHGAVVLADDVADRSGNATRFVWLARDDRAAWPPPPPGADVPWRTALVFDGAGDGTPGWLVLCLSEFASRGVNLTRIASRPSGRRMGHYVFHVDLDGRHEGALAEAVDALRPRCEHVRVLGTYPRASL